MEHTAQFTETRLSISLLVRLVYQHLAIWPVASYQHFPSTLSARAPKRVGLWGLGSSFSGRAKIPTNPQGLANQSVGVRNPSVP